MLYSVLFAVSAFLPTITARDYPVFTLDCSSYPDVCDTHCYALACAGMGTTDFRDVNRYLHYAPSANSNYPNPATDQSEGTYRRQAIGCTTSGCATDYLGTECDEFPYASTYDGGLGCIIDRYRGPATEIARTGVYHCADEDHNSLHGEAIKAFYRTAGLANGGRFQVGFNEANVDMAQGCKIIRKGGTGVCAAVRAAAFGRYSVRKTVPGPTSYCPRAQRRRRTLTDDDDEPESPLAEETSVELPPWDGPVNITWTRSIDSHGNVILFPYRDDTPPTTTRVFHVKRDGSVLQSHIA